MINEELENYTEDGSSTLNNGESYGSDLGYEDDEIALLAEEKVIGDTPEGV